MEFRTLQRLASQPPQLQPGSSSSAPALGRRPRGYNFDTADFAKYQTMRDSYLESCDSARRALSVGGVIARLAREVLPVSAILAGPSQDALKGNQDVLICDGEVFVDDGLSTATKKMLCGTYEEDNGTAGEKGMYAWFPLENSWNSSGLQVGHWTNECEDWYKEHFQKILDGKFSPLPSSKWRTAMRLTQLAPRLLYLMNNAALDFLQYSPSACLHD
ncbi:hypothetical protein BDZ97DRAFT_1664433 [Flammula alnicola]|nr:hypothetical protein BDZ97DRAFT_1664433 [Flammula alnicola]